MTENTDFRIIVIDDNPAIHHDFIKILTATTESGLDVVRAKMFGKKEEEFALPKFQIDTASQGQEGVERIKTAMQENYPYSLAFVDIRMPPGWDGIETIKHIWSLDKDIQVVICTAYSDYSWEDTVAHLGKTDNLLILKKPFDNVSVRQLACALTKKWQLLQDTRKFTSSLKQQVNDRTLSLQKSLSLVKATLESSDEGIIVISNEGKIVDYNQKFCGMWDIPQAIIDSKSEKKLQAYMQDQLVEPGNFSNWLKSLHERSDAINIDIIRFKNGKILDCYSQPQKLNDQIVGRVLNFRDVTERIHLENELQYQAKHDALTGLPNRVMLLEKARELIKKSEKNNTLLAVMFIDLDRFKLVNDSLSHAAGDELLRATATRLQAVIGEGDILARLGGDEFVILITNVKNNEEIINKASIFMKVFQQPFHLAERHVTITGSIGISIFPTDGKTMDILMRNADAAMYHAKELGSNNFQFYTVEMNEKSLQKLDQEMQLRQAMKNGELLLHYQPQFDLNNEKLIAAEALLRWQHPQKGLLLPIDFVPLAEETGLIVPIGEWVIRTACKQNKEWQKAGFPPIRVAVNITAQQLKQQNIVDVVRSILNETELKPESLELELTENIIISSAEIIRTVTALKELGITIAIDDFGTGYSSLSYLKNLPLDRLKIDSSFIQHIQSEKDDEVIIRAIIAVAKNLKLEVLAEGVETKNQLNFLKKQQCDEIQGFYFSKPLSVTDMERLFTHPESKKDILSTSESKGS
ncbi:MAG: EAL domain-containing protein [Gammaproteobacteria bacterium]|nr:MAG: EAL domain-containing protein [Gammaproteobacteria bacterium]